MKRYDTPMKCAYLIIAHNQPRLLQVLIELLDDRRNDIFVHIDKKSDFNEFKGLKTQQSQLVFTERVDVAWGGYSQVEAEYTLFDTAFRHDHYDYFHLISGADLPLMTQDEIHRFLEAHPRKEYISFASEDDENNRRDIHRKTAYHHLFVEHYRDKSAARRFLCHIIRGSFVRLQKLVGYERHYDFPLLKCGNWMSLTHECTRFILERREYVKRTFRHIPCVDEICIPCLILDSSFRANIYKEEELGEYMREIDWRRGSPYVWKDEDFDHLIHCGKFFARKFSEEHFGIVERIASYLKSKRHED